MKKGIDGNSSQQFELPTITTDQVANLADNITLLVNTIRDDVALSGLKDHVNGSIEDYEGKSMYTFFSGQPGDSVRHEFHMDGEGRPTQLSIDASFSEVHSVTTIDHRVYNFVEENGETHLEGRIYEEGKNDDEYIEVRDREEDLKMLENIVNNPAETSRKHINFLRLYSEAKNRPNPVNRRISSALLSIIGINR